MSDVQRLALARDIARRLQLASLDEIRVLDALLLRLELGRERYGHLGLGRDRRDWAKERREELLDAIVYELADELATLDRQRAELHEAARLEMLGEPAVAEFTGDQHKTRISGESARIAPELAELREWETADKPTVISGETSAIARTVTADSDPYETVVVDVDGGGTR